MTPRNYEGRQFGDKHQARFLASWVLGGRDGEVLWSEDLITPANLDPDSPRKSARHGDWIILAADGTVRIEGGGSQDGYCTDCGQPVWWHDERLVTRSGLKWCQGKDDSHPGWGYQHALPGMPQWVARSPDGKVCHCLDRDGPHIHEIITTPPDQAHRLANLRKAEGDDILADLRAEDGHVPDGNRIEAERRLWQLLEESGKS